MWRSCLWRKPFCVRKGVVQDIYRMCMCVHITTHVCVCISACLCKDVGRRETLSALESERYCVLLYVLHITTRIDVCYYIYICICYYVCMCMEWCFSRTHMTTHTHTRTHEHMRVNKACHTCKYVIAHALTWTCHEGVISHLWMCHATHRPRRRRVIKPIHMCDMIHLRAWLDSFICVTSLIHIYGKAPPYVWPDSCICVTWLVYRNEWGMSYVWHDLCMTRFITMCNLTHSGMTHESFICVTWLIHT